MKRFYFAESSKMFILNANLTNKCKTKNFQYPRDCDLMENYINNLKKDWWWGPSLWNYSLKQINNTYTHTHTHIYIYVDMYIYLHQAEDYLFVSSCEIMFHDTVFTFHFQLEEIWNYQWENCDSYIKNSKSFSKKSKIWRKLT